MSNIFQEVFQKTYSEGNLKAFKIILQPQPDTLSYHSDTNSYDIQGLNWKYYI